ncbi:MAG: membrane protein [Sulfuricurvum sp. PC08-66]|nr:MAG: membrane protein [Sulfuricurvum sp. PC08-66]
MNLDTIERIKNDPDYQALVKTRTSFAIWLSISMLVVYFAFILVIAFDPTFLGTRISSDSVTSIGIPIGMFVIFFAIVITGIYTRRANGEFDALNNKIKAKFKDAL